MSHWENEFGDEFETREEALESVTERMDDRDLTCALEYSIGFSVLLDWAMQQDGFWDHFCDEIEQAEMEFFSDNYYEVEDEEEDE